MENPQVNLQIRTRATARQLVTELITAPRPQIQAGQVLVEVLYVPLHGSFWLATHPHNLHPRRHEFLQDGSFVFGSGGVGRVLEVSGSNPARAQVGDFVTLFGHLPCQHADCRSCWQLHRYVECDYGQGRILGHGKGGPDGSYARYVGLPPYSYEVCYRAAENPDESHLTAFMYAYLFADVRNACSRNSGTLGRERMLLIGAGQSALIAAYLHLSSGADHRLVVVDPCLERACRVQSMSPERVEFFCPPQNLIERLNAGQPVDLEPLLVELSQRCRQHFQGRACDLVFDASSGNATPLWAHPCILSPGCLCIPFGFGSQGLQLSPELLQLSGLTIRTSRGVGDLHNRRLVVERLRAEWSEISRRFLVSAARRLSSLEEAMDFIREQHMPPRPLHQVELAYITPNPLDLPASTA
ncbi:zinc-binding dehydrogenase [bacterium]|nr:zinc-binding dehydrogenase [bacterium]